MDAPQVTSRNHAQQSGDSSADRNPFESGRTALKAAQAFASRAARGGTALWKSRLGPASRHVAARGWRLVSHLCVRVRRVTDMGPSVVSNSPVELPTLAVNGNWRLPAARQPQLMVHDLGASLEGVRSTFLDRLRKEPREDVLIGRPAEMADLHGERRAVRVAHRFQRGHCSTTDVVLRTEGEDLYVSFGSRARTLLTYLDYGGRALLVGLGVVFAMSLYLSGTGAREAWAKDYADRRAAIVYQDAGAAAFMANRLTNGGQTIDWAWFTREVWSDPVAAAAVNRYVERVIRELSPMPGSEYFLRPVFDAHGEHVLQFVLAGQIPLALGQQVYPWFDPAQPIKVVTNDGHVHSDTFAFTAIETPDATPLLARIASLDAGLAEHVVPILQRSIVSEEPWSLLRLAEEDPRTAFFNLGMPITLLLSILGFFVWRMPRSWMRLPCAVLRWMTPEEFDAQALSRNAWVERQLAKTFADFGVGRAQVTELHGGGHVG